MSDAHDQRTNTPEARERQICELLTGDRVTPLMLERIELMEAQARRHHFHGCSECPPEKGPDDIYTAGKAERAVCHRHRTSWLIGANLTSQWRNELEVAGGDWELMCQRQRERYRELEDYRNIDREEVGS